jgi:hypothetical protein
MVSDDIAKEGLRIHNVKMEGRDNEIILGETYTALCGEEWQPTLKGDDLEGIPFCYGCLEARFYEAQVLAYNIHDLLATYDREHNVD